jgi:hypothetical protein
MKNCYSNYYNKNNTFTVFSKTRFRKIDYNLWDGAGDINEILPTLPPNTTTEEPTTVAPPHHCLINSIFGLDIMFGDTIAV